MTRSRRLLELGEAFAVPLTDGRFGLMRVVALKESHSIMGLTEWVGGSPPVLSEIPRPALLSLTHHTWGAQPCLLCVFGRPPRSYPRVGIVLPTPEEQALDSGSLSDWDFFGIQALLEWKWRRDRESVLAEDRERERVERLESERRMEQRKLRLSRVTLQQLGDEVPFPAWRGHPSQKFTASTVKLFKRTVRRLIELGAQASRDEKLVELRRFIVSLNELDSKYSQIETVEREDILDRFEELAHACGIPESRELADEWRDW